MQQMTGAWSRLRQRFVIVAVAAALCVPALAAVDVQVLGSSLPVSPSPVLDAGSLIGPPAEIAKALGCRVTSPGEATLQIVTPAGTEVRVKAGSDLLLVNGTEVKMPRMALIVSGQIVCPLRPVLDAIGAGMQWNAAAQRLHVTVPITAIRVHADDAGARVEITAPLRAQATLSRVNAPERAYVDLPGATVKLQNEFTLVSCGEVQRVRWAQFTDDPPTARIVMDLSSTGTVRWEPHPQGLGGSMVIGRVDGDEPLVERRVPMITGIDARSPDEDTTLVRIELSDLVRPKISVRSQPPTVTLKFPDAAPAATSAPVGVASPFVGAMQLSGTPGVVGAELTLQMKQLIHFELDDSADPPAVTVIFKRGRISDKRIVIDAGHGGRDSGARGNRLLEKEINLDVARQVATKLMQMGAQITLTRDGDYYVDLYDRPGLANRISADLFLSIHCNAMPTRNTGFGTETFYYHDRSMCLGAVVHEQLVKAMGRKDRGLKWANFCVTRESHMPAVLVELLFLNSDVEEGLLAKPEVRTAAANALVEGLRQYVEGTGSTLDTEMGM